jgi:hypothetical protein
MIGKKRTAQKEAPSHGPHHFLHDRAAKQIFFRGTILRGLTQPRKYLLSKFCYCYVTYVYPVVLPAHLSQHAKVATADDLTSSADPGRIYRVNIRISNAVSQ